MATHYCASEYHPELDKGPPRTVVAIQGKRDPKFLLKAYLFPQRISSQNLKHFAQKNNTKSQQDLAFLTKQHDNEGN